MNNKIYIHLPPFQLEQTKIAVTLLANFNLIEFNFDLMTCKVCIDCLDYWLMLQFSFCRKKK